MKHQEFNEERERITVSQLIEILKSLPQDATARAYEGEVTGIIIETRSPNQRWGKEIARIHTRE